jgi:PilZ domain
MKSASKIDPELNARAVRYASHTLVEVRRFKHLPFGIHSAVLLDISLGGFKFEFTSENQSKPGQQFWISIPMAPLGIYAPSRLLLRGECRWFDPKAFRIGGVFMDLTKTDKLILEQVVETLKQRGVLEV